MEYFMAYRAFFSQQLWGYFTLYGNSSPKKNGSLCGNNMPNRQVSPPLIHGICSDSPQRDPDFLCRDLSTDLVLETGRAMKSL
jgi:hypothetical protein